MVEKEKIADKLKIKQKAIFDMGELYQVMFRWFNHHDYDFQEKEYLEKRNSDGSRNLEIKWIATKKISDYFKFQIDIFFRLIALTDVEVELDGKKKKANRASPAEIEFSATLLKDYEGRWGQNGFLTFIREVYYVYIIMGRINDYKADLYGEVYEIIDEIKAFLNMYKFEGLTV